MRTNPFVYLENFGEVSIGLIGMQVEPRLRIDDNSFNGLNIKEQREVYLRRIGDVLRCLHESSVITSICLRYHYFPDAVNVQSQFAIFLLVRVDGNSELEARYKAEVGWKEITNSFPLGLYILRPIVDEREFYLVHTPIRISDAEIIEVRKSEEVTPPMYVAAGDYYYHTSTISSTHAPVETVLEIVSQSQAPLLVSICLSPTRLSYEEIASINQVVGLLNRFSNGFSVRMLSGTTMFEADPNALVCLEKYMYLVANVQNLFQYRLQIISSEPVPPHLVSGIAAHLSGKYSIQRPSSEHSEDAQWTYEFLDPYPIWGGHSLWLTEDAPQSLRRISYLVSLEEALQLFKLPIRYHERETKRTIYAGTYVERMEQVTSKFEISNSTIGMIAEGGIKDVEAITVNVGTLESKGDAEVAKAMEAVTQAVLNSVEISQDAQRDLLEQLTELSQQATLPPEKRYKPSVIKALIAGIATGIGTAGGLAEVWATWGPTITNFFNR